MIMQKYASIKTVGLFLIIGLFFIYFLTSVGCKGEDSPVIYYISEDQQQHFYFRLGSDIYLISLIPHIEKREFPCIVAQIEIIIDSRKKPLPKPLNFKIRKDDNDNFQLSLDTSQPTAEKRLASLTKKIKAKIADIFKSGKVSYEISFKQSNGELVDSKTLLLDKKNTLERQLNADLFYLSGETTPLKEKKEIKSWGIDCWKNGKEILEGEDTKEPEIFKEIKDIIDSKKTSNQFNYDDWESAFGDKSNLYEWIKSPGELYNKLFKDIRYPLIEAISSRLEDIDPLLMLVMVTLAVLVLFLLLLVPLSRFIKRNSRKALEKLAFVEEEFRRPENLTSALARISNIINNLKDRIEKLPEKKNLYGLLMKKSDKLKAENEQQEIIKNLDLLDNEIRQIEDGKEYDLVDKITKFEEKLAKFELFFSDLILKSKTNKLRKALLKTGIKTELSKIKNTIDFIKIDFRQYTVLVDQFKKILLEQGQYLDLKKKSLDDFLSINLKTEFSQFENLKENISKLLTEQITDISAHNSNLKQIIGRIDITKNGFESLKKLLADERDKLETQNTSLSKNNSEQKELIKQLQHARAEFERKVSEGLDSQNVELSKSNIEQNKILRKMETTRTDFGNVIEKFEDLKKEISEEALKVDTNLHKNFSGINRDLREITKEIKGSEAVLEDLKGKTLEKLISLNTDLENKIKQTDQILEKLDKYIDSSLVPKIIETLNENLESKQINKLYLDFINKKLYLKISPETGIPLINRIKDEPEFSETYRLLAINLFKDMDELQKKHQDKWYWKLLNPLWEQLDYLLLPFFYFDGKTIYDDSLENKPAGFNLKDLKKEDLKKIINEDHWIKIWEPLLRWAYFFKAYFYFDEDLKYVVEWQQYYATKIEKIFQESLGYQIELYQPMEMISKKMVEKGQVKEISRHDNFFQQILPNIKNLEKFKEAEEKLKLNPNMKLIVFVDQLGLLDKGKRIRESKLLFHSPLLMELERQMENKE